MDLTARPPIVTFRDALGFAMELAGHHARADAAALVGPDGRVVDLAIRPGPAPPSRRTVPGVTDSIDAVTRWACGADRWCEPPTAVLLVSVRPVDPGLVREADIARFRHADWSLASAGCRLADWIETDGDLYRSHAYLIRPTTAWTTDPPADRRVDRDQP